MKYAIKYRKVRYDEDIDLLVPQGLVQGELQGSDYFSTKDEVFTYVTNPILDGKVIIGDAYTIDELRKIYNCDTKSYTDDEVINFFYMDQEDKLSAIRDGKRVTISMFDVFDADEKTIYQNIDGESCLFLNQTIIDELQDIDDINLLKDVLKAHSDRLANFDEKRISDGVEAILVKNGHVVEIDTSSKVNSNVNINTNDKVFDINSDEFSVKGLYNYLKSCIIGHDEELKAISTILFMNFESNPLFGTESILIPGPTGTGKTATFNCAAQYFNVPFKNINTCNLVPEGIVGTTVEDEFASLIDACGGDISKAEKAIIVFDEFDKLGMDGLDIKSSLVNIFLKVLEGSSFPINRQMKATRIYNTLMSSKVCLGTFVEAYKKDKSIGFNSSEVEEIFDKDLLVKKGYFTNELLTRFIHFVPYGDLTMDDKKRIILESKLSTYLLKKQRLESQYGIIVDGDNDFADAVLEELKKDSKSVRDINNIIASAFLDIEYEILNNKGKYKRLTLSKDTTKFDLR